MSVDVWKTLKVWMDGSASRSVTGPLLSIVTTGIAQPSSAMSFLRSEGRNVDEALTILNAAAVDSTNAETAAARTAWMGMNAAERYGMVDRIYVHDSEVTIELVDELIQQELSLSAPFGHEGPYFDRVLEWWNKASIGMLVGQRSTLTGFELRARLSDIRDYFRADNLPTMVQLSDVDEEQLAADYQDEMFVQQLKWIKLNATHLSKAVVDYHRAVTQTVRWLDDSLIGVLEIQEFEDNLADEWERAFADMEQDLPPDADDATRERAGLTLFRALSSSTGITIRALYDEAFYARGKRHELANVGQLGWHPNFRGMLAALTVES